MRERLDVLDQRRAPEVPDLARERRLEPRHRSPALHRLEHRRLLARDVRAGADDELERQPVEQPRGAKLVERLLESRARRCVLLAEVDVALGRLERPHREHRRLEHEMRPELHHVAVLDRPRLALVGVHDDVARARLARDRLPLDPGREAGAAVAREPRRLELVDDPLERRHARGEARARRAPRSPRASRRRRRARPPARRSSSASPRGRSRRRASSRARDRSGRGRRPRSLPASTRAARARRSSRTPARCRRERRPSAPAGTSRRRRPRAPRRAGCSCGRRARRTAPS